MPRRTKREVLAFVLGLAAILVVFLGSLWKSAVDRSGPGPAEPFRIAGNFFYVGADAVSAFLLTGPEGHVVIDGGYPRNAPMIVASIAQLGFDITDVKVLLNSIPYREHAGGLAALQRASGARLWASESSAGVIATGGDNPDIFMPVRALFQIGLLGYPRRAWTTGSRTATRSVSGQSRSPRTSRAAARAAAPRGRSPSATVSAC